MCKHKSELCSQEEWNCYLILTAQSKPDLHMTGIFLDIQSRFLMFPQAGLFINMPALVTVAWLLTLYSLNLDLQMYARLCNYLSVIVNTWAVILINTKPLVFYKWQVAVLMWRSVPQVCPAGAEPCRWFPVPQCLGWLWLGLAGQVPVQPELGPFLWA